MHIAYRDLDLTLAHPFRISRSTQLAARNVLVSLEHDGLIGLGEAAPSVYYGEDRATVFATLDRLSHAIDHDPFDCQATIDRLDGAIRRNTSAKAALDVALHDWIGKRLGIPLHRLLGLSASRTPLTSYTIGIDTPEVMAQKAIAAAQYPILKVKVGTGKDRANLAAIREVSTAKLRVDANGAWTAKQAVRAIHELEEFDLELIEQPVAAADLEGLKFVRDRVSPPIICDESCVEPADIPHVAGKVDGVNIKLSKCGGVRRAIEMIHTARAHGMLVMMGCMIESSVLITAAAHLSPLLDFADLDGNLLLASDPYRGVDVVDGKLILPSEPGLGVMPRSSEEA